MAGYVQDDLGVWDQILALRARGRLQRRCSDIHKSPRNLDTGGEPLEGALLSLTHFNTQRKDAIPA